MPSSQETRLPPIPPRTARYEHEAATSVKDQMAWLVLFFAYPPSQDRAPLPRQNYVRLETTQQVIAAGFS